MNHSVLGEGGFEPGQLLGGGAAADAFVFEHRFAHNLEQFVHEVVGIREGVENAAVDSGQSLTDDRRIRGRPTDPHSREAGRAESASTFFGQFYTDRLVRFLGLLLDDFLGHGLTTRAPLFGLNSCGHVAVPLL